MDTCNRGEDPTTAASYWRYLLGRVQARVSRGRVVPGRELGDVVDINRLVCPLRYDISIRIDFVRLLKEQWNLYARDLSGFLNLGESQAYYVWFKDVACARFQPQVARDEQRLKPAFIERVHETARLWHSIQTRGYDPSTPIRIRAGHSVRPVNGKLLNARHFAGDGCHRLACLYVGGHTRLLPEQYEVMIQASLQPLDNTATLIRQLPLDRAAYLHFISTFYCQGQSLNTAEAILAHVAASHPGMLAELQSVFAFDLPRFPDQ
jgi:hypothetical protein